MLDFFQFIVDFFSKIGTFLSGLFDSFLSFFQLIGQAALLLPELSTNVFTPAIIGSMIAVVVGIAVIKLVVGR